MRHPKTMVADADACFARSRVTAGPRPRPSAHPGLTAFRRCTQAVERGCRISECLGRGALELGRSGCILLGSGGFPLAITDRLHSLRSAFLRSKLMVIEPRPGLLLSLAKHKWPGPIFFSGVL